MSDSDNPLANEVPRPQPLRRRSNSFSSSNNIGHRTYPRSALSSLNLTADVTSDLERLRKKRSVRFSEDLNEEQSVLQLDALLQRSNEKGRQEYSDSVNRKRTEKNGEGSKSKSTSSKQQVGEADAELPPGASVSSAVAIASEGRSLSSQSLEPGMGNDQISNIEKKEDNSSKGEGQISRSSSGQSMKDISKFEPSPGKLEDKYELSQVVLGSGAFGTVKLAVCKEDEKEYAVKIVKKTEELMRDTDFLEEVRIMSRIQHPNIIYLVDKYETEQELHLVMEIASGGELFDRMLSQNRFEEREVRHIAQQLMSAVSYLHSLGITHRDLKPENILLANDSRYPTIKITDFGFAKHLQNKEMLLRARAKRGTMGYAAPEIFSGRNYDEKCDIWSLGIILYIMIAGVPPFCSLSEYTVEEALSLPFWKHANNMKKVPTSNVDFPKMYWRGVSDEAQHFLSLMLERDPMKRARAVDLLKHPWFKMKYNMSVTSTLQGVLPLPSMFKNKNLYGSLR